MDRGPFMVPFLDHSVCLEVHGGVGFYVVALVNGTGKVNCIVFIAVDAEDLLWFGLDLSDKVHQLAAIGMT